MEDISALSYPVAFAAQRVGGSRVGVTNLTPVGAEPHDLELNSDQLDQLLGAKVAFVLGSDFQPAVEKAAARRDGPTVQLLPKLVDARGKKVAKEGQTGGLDPHVWLDPVLAQSQVEAIRAGLEQVDGANKSAYDDSARAFRARLGQLDAAFQAGLRDCVHREMVVSHASFAYLGRRYRLAQVPLMGLAPESEPSPAALAAITSVARQRKVRYIFFETLVSPRLAETLAREIGAGYCATSGVSIHLCRLWSAAI